MSIPNFELLKDFFIGIEEVLAAPPYIRVRVRHFDQDESSWICEMTVGELQKLLEGCTYDEDFRGWLVTFPGQDFDEVVTTASAPIKITMK